MLTTKKQREELKELYIKTRRLYKTGKYSYALLGFRAGYKTEMWVWKVLRGKGFPLLDSFNFKSLVKDFPKKLGKRRKKKAKKPIG